SYKPALVAINPTNGRVLAYYGGPKGDGVGWDYAGPNYGKDGSFLGGGRPPGSSFKIYTLLAALTAGYGFDTTWDSTLKKVGGEVGFGQYAITPLDHANGVATLANDGVYNRAHFVVKVEKRDQKTGVFKPYHSEQTKGRQAFSKDVVAAIDHVLLKVPGH